MSTSIGGYILARINIEDSVFKSDEYAELILAAGSRICAIGSLACLWIEAQKHYLTLGEIPIKNWVKANLPEYLIQTGWAARTETGVKARGQDEQFKWLLQAQAAGEKSAAARKTKSNGRQPPLTGDGVNAQRASRASQPPTPSLPPPLPLSQTPLGVAAAEAPAATPVDGGSNEDDVDLFGPEPQRKAPRKVKAAVEAEPTLGSQIFAAYAEEYAAVYGDEPVRDATANTLCKAIGKALGAEGIEVARFYVRHPKAFYGQAMHPLTMLKTDASALRTQMRTGKIVTAGEARTRENKQQNYNAFSKYTGGKNGK